MTAFKKGACLKRLIAITGAIGIGGVAFLYSGLYSMGADDPHYDITTWALETLRENSISRSSKNIEVPSDLDSVDRLLKGGADYNDMCAGCHLKPGKTESDFTLGLYPSPPNLADISRAGEDAQAADQRNFWIIKHGIKASGMPAWAPGHDDVRIWNMVAFLKRLPDLTEAQYQILTARGKSDEGHH
ncbi:c-type cytochrome [Neptunomonas concharum]|uniref:Cytochrome c n=1 Tax=Neptunomonas concharum TaxID=1031538 RepID=A0A5P1RAZ9_9GAMM|nr:cytochrome c [Neptunomonas concharum]QEQ96788.1 cytochrome c [Neptunomonas concharum]